MSYEKTEWIDHVVDPETQEIIQQGTRVTAQRMNKIEEGIEVSHSDHELHLDESVYTSGAHGLVIEEGVFTPLVAGGTIAGLNTYTTNTGFYQKIGTRVFFDIVIIMSAKDAAMSGIAVITGLPFVASPQKNRRFSCSIGAFGNINPTADIKELSARVDSDFSRIIITESKNVASTTLFATAITNTTLLYVSGSYEI